MNKMENVVGLERDQIRFADHTSAWHDLFIAEAEQIRLSLGELLVEIEHFGSTAIPGIKAKPILDILAAVERIENGPACIPPLESIGYTYRPNAGIPGDLTFTKGGDRVTHILHVVQIDSLNWRGNLKFRDALRASPTLAREYEQLKLELAGEFQDRAQYTAGKTDFVWRVISPIDLDADEARHKD
jgi:GrpB-like predicted nucleotidyltransferase (UPF0157 family)